MADFNIQYEGTKFSFTVYNENNEPMSYEFLIRQEAGDPKWKWIYLPYGEKSIRVNNWVIPCEPVPSFNTEHGIELSFVAIIEKKEYGIKVFGGNQNKYFSDNFVAKVFQNAIEFIINKPLNVIENIEQVISIPYKEAHEENENNIELRITSNPV